MKCVLAILAAAGLSLGWVTARGEEAAAPKAAAPKDELKTPIAKLSYALGLEIGTALKTLETDIDVAGFMRGLEDNLKGKTPLLTAEQADQVKEEFFKKLQEDRAKKAKELGEKNKKAGEAFLAANKTKKGVVTTASGLQYIALKEGDGAKPKSTDQVKVHYRGTLIDGTEFDSSYKRKEPVVFPVTGVIAGWSEALLLMKVGGKYQVFVPSGLAYGERGGGRQIGPNSTLIFEVELLSIEKPEPEDAPEK